MEQLVERHLRPVIGKVPGVTAAVVDGDDEHVFGLGSMAERSRPRRDCWEIGSITKVFTGMLLAEMVRRGEVGLDDAIGTHLPPAVADRLGEPETQPTLEDLATHHAGLPSIPARWLLGMMRSPDPYARLSEARVFDQLGPRTKRPRKATFSYSNLGMGLLGHLLERTAGQPYATLLRERLLDPLGLDDTGVGTCGPGTEVVVGHRRGKPTPPWTFGAIPACGAVRSTIADMVSFARSVIEPSSGRVGEALLMAMEPRRGAGRAGRDMQVGLGWMTRTDDRGPVVWHNGGTHGTSSFLAVDRERRLGVVLLGNAGPRLVPRLDAPGWAIIDELRARPT